MKEAVRSFKMATWLGWQIESNWADPFLFGIYSIARPVSAALILVVMYSVVAQGGPGHPLFPYMYIGNAFYLYVGSVLIGFGNSANQVLDDEDVDGFINLGVRMFWERTTFSITGFRPLMEDSGDFIAFPVVMFARHW